MFDHEKLDVYKAAIEFVINPVFSVLSSGLCPRVVHYIFFTTREQGSLEPTELTETDIFS